MGADDANTNGVSYEVGYRRPPRHTRFKPGVSGNPSGRPKGAQNFRYLFDRILNEQIALQDGPQSKKITKAEAIMRRLILGALKGDSRSLGTLFRLAEQTGQFTEDEKATTNVQVVRFTWESDQPTASSASRSSVPAISHLNRE